MVNMEGSGDWSVGDLETLQELDGNTNYVYFRNCGAQLMLRGGTSSRRPDDIDGEDEGMEFRECVQEDEKAGIALD